MKIVLLLSFGVGLILISSGFSFAYGQYTTAPLEKEVTFPVREEEMVYCFAKADPKPSKNITELDITCNMVALPQDKQDDMDVYLDNWNRQYIEIEGQEPYIDNIEGHNNIDEDSEGFIPIAPKEEEEEHDDHDDSNSKQRTWSEVIDGGVSGFIDFLKENHDGE